MAPNIEPKQISNKSPLRKETGSAEIYFAKRLANNEKKIRDKSLKRLHHWLASRQKAENGKGFFLSCLLNVYTK